MFASCPIIRISFAVLVIAFTGSTITTKLLVMSGKLTQRQTWSARNYKNPTCWSQLARISNRFFANGTWVCKMTWACNLCVSSTLHVRHKKERKRERKIVADNSGINSKCTKTYGKPGLSISTHLSSFIDDVEQQQQLCCKSWWS